MKSGDIYLLKQLVNSLESAMPKLEQAYEQKDIDSFNKAKRFMIQVQKKISEVIKWRDLMN